MSARSMICRLAVCLGLLPAAAAAQLDKIPWAKGPTKGVLGAEATITVPASCLFTGMDGVKAFPEATQNNASGNERGVLLCPANGTTDTWFVLFSYDESGYVRDDEGASLDADAILESVRRGTEAGNRERKRRGWGTLTVEGWATKPLEGLNLNELGASLASQNGSGMWCPRCGATFVQGESCSECDIHLVPAGRPSPSRRLSCVLLPSSCS